MQILDILTILLRMAFDIQGFVGNTDCLNIGEPLPSTGIKLGDEVFVYSMANQRPIRGIIRWLGNVKVRSKEVAIVGCAGLEIVSSSC